MRILKMRVVTLGALVAMAMVFSAANVQAVYIETFDLNNASWNYGYDTSFLNPKISAPWSNIGGNPGGYIYGDSVNTTSGKGLYAIWTYDTTPYGDMTGLKLTVDTKVTDSETGTAQFYVGKSGSYYIDGTWNIGADKAWTTHTTILDAAHFSAWCIPNCPALTLADVLAAPDDIGIFFGGGLVNGTGQVGVDNYGTVPEPTTLLLLGLGLVGLVGLNGKFGN